MIYLYDACDQISDFCHQQLLEKNATKNILDGRTEVKQYTPSPFGERGYNYFKKLYLLLWLNLWKIIGVKCISCWGFVEFNKDYWWQVGLLVFKIIMKQMITVYVTIFSNI